MHRVPLGGGARWQHRWARASTSSSSSRRRYTWRRRCGIPRLPDGRDHEGQGIRSPTLPGGSRAPYFLAFLSRRRAGAMVPSISSPGARSRGRLLFGEKGCAQCHPIAENVGPSLVGRGTRRSPIEFAAALWDKAPAMQAARKPEMGEPRLSSPPRIWLICWPTSTRQGTSPGRQPEPRLAGDGRQGGVSSASTGSAARRRAISARTEGSRLPRRGARHSLWNHDRDAPAPGAVARRGRRSGRRRWPT